MRPMLNLHQLSLHQNHQVSHKIKKMELPRRIKLKKFCLLKKIQRRMKRQMIRQLKLQESQRRLLLNRKQRRKRKELLKMMNNKVYKMSKKRKSKMKILS